ncbi:MAG: hypothetical protein JJT94_14445 [Bernardetiaceae bacterium]|nr:hypothetical protein [Bernardetiaceae bacterium]
MERSTLLQERHATVEYDKESKAICITWRGFIMLDDFKNTMLTALEAFHEHRAKHWIIDQTMRQAVQPAINEWVINEYYPMMIDAKQEDSKIAVIVSKDVFARFSMRNQADSLVGKYEGRMLPFGYFESLTDTKKWLQKKES